MMRVGRMGVWRTEGRGVPKVRGRHAWEGSTHEMVGTSIYHPRGRSKVEWRSMRRRKRRTVNV